MTGFNGEGNGKAFDPPLQLPGATGLRFTCGYDNWRNETIGWGNGDGEMCVLLALVEADAVLGSSVDAYNHLVEAGDDIRHYEGPCLTGAVPKKANQSLPTAAERGADFYVPPQDPADAEPARARLPRRRPRPARGPRQRPSAASATPSSPRAAASPPATARPRPPASISAPPTSTPSSSATPPPAASSRSSRPATRQELAGPPAVALRP
ncbi:MAG: hypothetical protein IPG88_13120 [Gemmatimonadetes bacterium]|nr:hypothetical protein [Gemmatimonadota bacterium]